VTAGLREMHWPAPVPIAMWKGDYADIRDRIRRTGRLDTDDLWEAASGDSWNAFRGYHGSAEFGLTYAQSRALRNKQQKEAAERAYQRRTAAARQAQEAWEKDQRLRQQAKTRASDEEWAAAERQRTLELRAITRVQTAQQRAEMAAAKAWWSERDPGYAEEDYVHTHITKPGKLDDIEFPVGWFWLPGRIAALIKANKV